MKKLSFLIGAVILCSIADVHAAKSTVFTGIYTGVSNAMNEMTSERISAILNVKPELITEFISTGKLTNDQGDTLVKVCRHENESDENSSITKLQLSECLAAIQKMWGAEREYMREEVLEFQKSVAFARWWDGKLDSSSDFDVYSDIHLLEQQFFGKKQDSIDVPTASKGNQRLFSLARNGYRLPPDLLDFTATGGCGKGETSLYGGILCIPQFCSDFICVRVRAIPGRKGASSDECGKGGQASVQNILCGLEEIANTLKDAKQITPTRNTNTSYWWNQLFDSLQNLKVGITLEPRTPPILSSFSEPKEKATKKEYTYKNVNGEYVLEEKEPAEAQKEPAEEKSGEEKEVQKKSDEIRKEMDHVRREEFNACGAGHDDCKSEDVLKSFFHDCALLQSRVSAGLLYENAARCREERLQILSEKEHDDDQVRQEMIRDVKMEFFKEVPKNLNTLWGELSTFEDHMMSINLCKIQEAKNRCSGIKRSCTF